MYKDVPHEERIKLGEIHRLGPFGRHSKAPQHKCDAFRQVPECLFPLQAVLLTIRLAQWFGWPPALDVVPKQVWDALPEHHQDPSARLPSGSGPLLDRFGCTDSHLHLP